MKIHPWSTLWDELKARNLKQSEFANLIGVSRQFLNDLIKGRKNITPRLAVLLELALWISAEFWLNFQRSYDLECLKEDKKLQEMRNKIKEKLWMRYSE